MLSVDRMWPQLPSHFGNAICVQTSVPFRNAIKYPVHKYLCTLTYVYHFQRYSCACSLIVATSKWQKIVMRERAGRLVWKWKRRQRAKMQPLPGVVHGQIDDYEGEECQLAKQRNAWLSWEMTSSPSVRYSKPCSLPQHFHCSCDVLTMLTLCCTRQTIPKAYVTPTDSNAYV